MVTDWTDGTPSGGRSLREDKETKGERRIHTDRRTKRKDPCESVGSVESVNMPPREKRKRPQDRQRRLQAPEGETYL